MINEQRLREMINIAIQIAGSQKAFAKQVGISQQYLTDTLRGRRAIGTKLLKWFDLERVVSYRRIDGGQL
jgi:DNA-binding transcriptional regulator YdaS (Cro superfamily)